MPNTCGVRSSLRVVLAAIVPAVVAHPAVWVGAGIVVGAVIVVMAHSFRPGRERSPRSCDR